MQKLVEPLEVDQKGETTTKKLLQMNNERASKMDIEEFPLLIENLELVGKPQMVIVLRESTHGVSWQDNVNQQIFSSTSMVKGVPEENDEHAKHTLESLILFLQKAIVPLAISTNAVVIVSGLNKCALTNAMSIISSNIRKAKGGELPYSLVCITSEEPIWFLSCCQGNFANALRNTKFLST